jgi:hypothetical protein
MWDERWEVWTHNFRRIESRTIYAVSILRGDKDMDDASEKVDSASDRGKWSFELFHQFIARKTEDIIEIESLKKSRTRIRDCT